VEVDKHFKLNPTLEFNIQLLDLFRTANRFDSHSLNKDNLPYFVEAMAQTNLLKSLKSVHVKEDDFKGIEMQSIFDKYKFKVRVKGDSEYPMIKNK
jgi:hypothetical protein